MSPSIATLLADLVILVLVLGALLVVGAVVGGLGNFVLGLLGHPVGKSLDARRVRPRIPARVRRAVLQRDGYRCQECGATEELAMDHIIALSRGGATTEENLQVLCRPCNERKGAHA